MPTLIQQIDAILPQTQCRQCGYQGCLPYAEAIVRDNAPINRCPPGGESGLQKLATLLGQAVTSLDTDCGVTKPLHIAKVIEQHCIGCTLCIKACPVDAIIGSNKRMHTVIAELCTGCELCIAPCPVDCIVMLPPAPHREWQAHDAERSRTLHRQRQQRLQRLHDEKNNALAAQSITVQDKLNTDTDDKKAAIAAALARARAARKKVSG